MGDCGEVWILDSRYDWEDVIGMEIEDAKFVKEVSSNVRKDKMQMQFIHDRQA